MLFPSRKHLMWYCLMSEYPQPQEPVQILQFATKVITLLYSLFLKKDVVGTGPVELKQYAISVKLAKMAYC